jgi:hypothetical protein
MQKLLMRNFLQELKIGLDKLAISDNIKNIIKIDEFLNPRLKAN